MYHRLWTFLNVFVILISFFYIWFFHPHESSFIVFSRIFAQIAILLFLININMYFIFLVIRKTSVRNVKIRLAKFSRKMMKWHIPIAILGTTVIIGHALINVSVLGPVLGFVHLKLVSGYFAFTLLLLTLFAGTLRHFKASGFRRKFHLISAITFFGVFILHMFIRV